MSEQNNHDSFRYTYSAKQQEELKKIRSKYLPKEEDKMETLRRLDAQATQKATMLSILVGVIGTLVMGLGMSCCMVWGDKLFVPGVIVGVIGLAALALAYPLYNKIAKQERDRVAPQILRLTEELMK